MREWVLDRIDAESDMIMASILPHIAMYEAKGYNITESILLDIKMIVIFIFYLRIYTTLLFFYTKEEKNYLIECIDFEIDNMISEKMGRPVR